MIESAKALLPAVFALTLLAACKSGPEKICDKMASLSGEEDDDERRADCVERMSKNLDGCDEASESVACFQALDDDEGKAVMKCMALCDDGARKLLAAANAPAPPPASGTSRVVHCKDKCEAAHGPLMDRPKYLECMQRTGNDVDGCSAKHINASVTACMRACNSGGG